MIIRNGYSPRVTDKVTNSDLRFLVPREPRLLNLWRSFVAVFSPTNRPIPNYRARMFHILDLGFLQRPARSLLGSALINTGVVFLLMWMVQKPFIQLSNSSALQSEPYEIYYIPPKLLAGQKIPRIAPAGPGGVPGQGDVEPMTTRIGSTAFHGQITIISQPPHPDNMHQTIIQPNIPPDIRLAVDLHLPNLLGNLPPQPKAPVPWRAPTWHAPTPTKTKMADLAPPTVASTSPDATLVVLGTNIPAPALPVVQPPPSGEVPSAPKSDPAVENANVSGLGAGKGGGLVVLSTDPSDAGSIVNLPLGNRAGSFSISPYGAVTGSPGGVTGGLTKGGGHGSKGNGGDGSMGVGLGNKGGGGGGGSNTDSGIFSVNGTDGESSGGTLGGSPKAADMVIRLAPFTSVHKNGLIVSTGPMGGGGLGVYQALSCRKIYTIFLPMPDTNWTLQYCLQDDPSAEQGANTAGGNTTIHLQQGLLPPAPELQFDFKRLPVPPEKARKMIVLKGTIREDGTVENVQVYAGVLPLMDEAARLAFSRWKFTPAMRMGKPVAVQFLVGIAVTLPKP